MQLVVGAQRRKELKRAVSHGTDGRSPFVLSQMSPAGPSLTRYRHALSGFCPWATTSGHDRAALIESLPHSPEHHR